MGASQRWAENEINVELVAAHNQVKPGRLATACMMRVTVT